MLRCKNMLLTWTRCSLKHCSTGWTVWWSNDTDIAASVIPELHVLNCYLFLFYKLQWCDQEVSPIQRPVTTREDIARIFRLVSYQTRLIYQLSTDKMRTQVGQSMPIMLVLQFYMGLQTAQQWCTPTPSTFITAKPQEVLSAWMASGLLYPWPCVIQLYLLLLMFSNPEIQMWVLEVLLELLWFTAAEDLSWSWGNLRMLVPSAAPLWVQTISSPDCKSLAEQVT